MKQDNKTLSGKEKLAMASISIVAISIFILVMSIIIISILHTFDNYTTSSIIVTSLLISIPLMILDPANGANAPQRPDNKSSSIREGFDLISGSFVGFLLIALVLTAKDKGPKLLEIAFDIFIGNPVLSQALFVIIVAGFLFVFRQKFRFWYGLSESLCGIIVAISKSESSISAMLNPSYLLLILTASIYLIVRGFDNMHQGINSIKSPFNKDNWLPK